MGLLASLAGLRTSNKKTVAGKSACKSSKYRGVQVNANDADCCMAVKTVAGKRFLSDDVPKLPLAACDADKCQCTYELHQKRRSDIRRASDVGYDIASQYCEQNNRNSSSTGRRFDD